LLRRLAESLDGTALEEAARRELVADARRALRGGGARTTAVEERRRVALAPWFVLGAAAPLAFVLATRNVAMD
jgi:hypothetical protein